MARKEESTVSQEALSRSDVSEVLFQNIRHRIIEELASHEGIRMVFTEPGDEENTTFIIMNRDDFDEALELEVYALQERLMNESGVPLSFVCLPRVALQAGVPSTVAEVLVNKAE